MPWPDSIPGASTRQLRELLRFWITRRGRLQNVSKLLIGFWLLSTAIEQADGAFASGGGEVHVADRCFEILMPGELLDRFGGSSAHREVRIERVTQDMHRAGRAEPGAS